MKNKDLAREKIKADLIQSCALLVESVKPSPILTIGTWIKKDKLKSCDMASACIDFVQNDGLSNEKFSNGITEYFKSLGLINGEAREASYYQTYVGLVLFEAINEHKKGAKI